MKRRFEFRLERVRRIRELEERVARAERASAEGLARAAETSRDEARAVLERSRAHLRELLRGPLEPLDPREVQHVHRALDHILHHLRRRVESARTLRTQAERMADAHLERRNAARALEELKERARARHAAELLRAENAALDEAAQRLAGTRNRESDSSAAIPPADQPPDPFPDRP